MTPSGPLIFMPVVLPPAPAPTFRVPSLPSLKFASLGAALLAPNSRFRLAEGDAVLLPTGSACQRKVWFWAAPAPLLNTEAAKSVEFEVKPPPEVAVPLAGRNEPPASVSNPLKLPVPAAFKLPVLALSTTVLRPLPTVRLPPKLPVPLTLAFPAFNVRLPLLTI